MYFKVFLTILGCAGVWHGGLKPTPDHALPSAMEILIPPSATLKHVHPLIFYLSPMYLSYEVTHTQKKHLD